MEDGTKEENKKHISEVAHILNSIAPDIVTVQEIKDARALNALAKATNLNVQVVSNFHGPQQLAILSRQQAQSAHYEAFVPVAATSPPRGFVHAAFFRGDDQILLVYGVHLKSNRGGIEENIPIREESARQLVRHAKEMDTLWRNQDRQPSFVIAGDFNTDPYQEAFSEEKTLGILKEAGFSWTGQGLLPGETATWISNGRYPDAAFDQIWVKDIESASMVIKTTPRSVSDHRPVSIVVAGDMP